MLAVYSNPLFLAFYRIKGIYVRPLLFGFIAPAGFLTYLLCLAEESATLEKVACGYLISQAVMIAIFVPDLLARVKPRFNAALLRQYARPGAVFCSSQSLDYLSARIDVLLVQYFAGPQAVGFYAAAQKIVSLLQILPSSFHVVELPEFHRLAAKPFELSLRFWKMRALMVELGLSLAGCLMLVAGDLIMLLFGDEYIAATSALRVLAWFAVMLFITYPYYMLAEALNRIEARLLAKLGTMLIAAIMIAVFVRQGGFTWAGWGLVIGQFMFIGILHGLTRRCAGGLREVWPSLWPAIWVGIAFGVSALMRTMLPDGQGWTLFMIAAYWLVYSGLALVTRTSVLFPTLKEASRALHARFGPIAVGERT